MKHQVENTKLRRRTPILTLTVILLTAFMMVAPAVPVKPHNNLSDSALVQNQEQPQLPVTQSAESGSVDSIEGQNIMHCFDDRLLAKENPVDSPPSSSHNAHPENTYGSAILMPVGTSQNSLLSTQDVQTQGMLSVIGYLSYYDNVEGVSHPCRQALCMLYDYDAPNYVLLATSSTDDSGYFSFGPVDNIDPEGGTQDIRVVWSTDGAASQVHDGSYIYACQGSTFDNVPDGTYNYGSWNVPTAQNGAWNIYDQIVKGYQWVDARPGTDAPPKVGVKWYIGNPDGTYYNPGGWIYILGTTSDPDEFDDGIILHEYGHFIAYTTWTTKPYTFDNSPGGGHTWDGTYSPELAWSEGWAHYLASTVRGTSTYRDTFSGGWVDYNLETGVATYNDGRTYNGNAKGDSCEASVAGILWDISDSVNDDQNGDGIGDTLSATQDMVWYVVRTYSTSGHGVYMIHEFWNGWFSNYQYNQQMWAVYYEHGINKDTLAPTNPNSYASNPAVNVWSNDNTIDISWSGATDDLSGVYGYSYVWDQNSGTTPDSTVDTTSTGTTSPALSDGNWYLHVRTRDRAGNWASTAYQVGPFKIDANSPSNPNSYTSSHTVNVWSNDNTVDISWSGASDGLSGVYGYSYVWDHFPSTLPDTTVDTTGTSTTSPALSDGVWYFHVRTRDNAGNWVAIAFEVGPFNIITNTVPTIDTPLNIVYQNGTTGHSITWHSSDSFDPSNYTITRNGAVVQTGNWDGGNISISVDGLFCGTYVTNYQYVCTVRDLLGNTVTSGTTTVTVRLELVNPLIDSPPDAFYVADEVGVWVTWHAWDAHPGTYVITGPKGTKSGTWTNGTSIQIDVGGLGWWTTGRYIRLHFQFTCTVYDACGNSASDTVDVWVLCAPEYG